MWLLGTWISGGSGRVGGIAGCDGLRGLFQPKWFCDSVICEILRCLLPPEKAHGALRVPVSPGQWGKKPLYETKKAFYGSGLAKDQNNSSQAIWLSATVWKNSKEGEIGAGRAKSPPGDIVSEGTREKLSCMSGQSLLQLLDKNDRSIFLSPAFF